MQLSLIFKIFSLLVLLRAPEERRKNYNELFGFKFRLICDCCGVK